MSRLPASPRVCLAAFFCAALGAGCQPAAPPLAPVSGKVTLDGQPVAAGQVSYQPVEAGTGPGMCAGTIDANGEYKLYSDGKAGAPPGKYKVLVTPPMTPPTAGGAPAAPFSASYQNPKTTPLTIEVVSNPEAGHYDLKLTR